MFRSILNKYVLGNKKFQGLFNKFYHYSKYGRNIGLPIEVATSGEEFIINKISNSFNNNEKFVFLDVGANSGDYTKLVLRHFIKYKLLECHLFEPQNDLVNKLKKDFKDLNYVFVNQFGLGSKIEKLKLFNFLGVNTISSVYAEFKGEVVSEEFTEINIIIPEEYLLERKISEVDFVKIDVEGHELEVLKGMGKFISDGKIKIIQFEFGSFNIASRTFFQDFWKLLFLKYNIFRILKDGLWEIKNYSIDLEIFDTTNYLAIRKDLNI